MMYAQSLDKMFAQNWTEHLVKLSKSLFKVWDFRAQFPVIVLNCEYNEKKNTDYFVCRENKQYLYVPNTRKC
jgi:phage anti-repressor protein